MHQRGRRAAPSGQPPHRCTPHAKPLQELRPLRELRASGKAPEVDRRSRDSRIRQRHRIHNRQSTKRHFRLGDSGPGAAGSGPGCGDDLS